MEYFKVILFNYLELDFQSKYFLLQNIIINLLFLIFVFLIMEFLEFYFIIYFSFIQNIFEENYMELANIMDHLICLYQKISHHFKKINI